MIFQTCYSTGCVPTDWRLANITPLFKKGAKSDPSNYRPVSLTSVVCKLMESIIRDVLVTALKDKFSCSQHGFMKHRSCLTNISESLEAWTKALDEGNGIDTQFIASCLRRINCRWLLTRRIVVPFFYAILLCFLVSKQCRRMYLSSEISEIYYVICAI